VNLVESGNAGCTSDTEEAESFAPPLVHNVGAVGDVPLQRTNYLHTLSCGILPTACYRIVLFFVRWA